jgi:hypothetical protein
MGVSVDTVMAYLYNQVGEGKIALSDILFTIGEETRKAVEEVEHAQGKMSESEFRRALRNRYPGVHSADAWIYLNLRKPEVYLGDMYTWLYALEKFLHDYIRGTLVREYGDQWWRKGIPDGIRAECAAALERDPEPAAEPYCYTTLVHLKEIFEKRWDLFSKLLPSGPASDRKRFLSGLTRLNLIRNRVMHASKGVVPNEDDFRFLREFLNFAEVFQWHERLTDSTEQSEPTVE